MRRLLTAGIVLAFFMAQSAFAGSREVIILGTSQGDVTYRVAVLAEPVLSEEGRSVLLQIDSSCSPDHYTAYEGTHKRTARYHYSGTREETLTINGVTAGPSMLIDLRPESIYRITAAVTFLWETSAGKASEGFPKYRSTRVTSEPLEIPGTEIQEASEGDPAAADGNGNGEKPKNRGQPLAIAGRAGHTTQWEENRNAYNEQAESGKDRAEEVFWPGEKILVAAETSGKIRRVTAQIEGTDIRTELTRRDGSGGPGGQESPGGSGEQDGQSGQDRDNGPGGQNDQADPASSDHFWEGSLFDPEMRTEADWQYRDAVICFTAEGEEGSVSDRVRIRLDGREDYFAMHRKE